MRASRKPVVDRTLRSLQFENLAPALLDFWPRPARPASSRRPDAGPLRVTTRFPGAGGIVSSRCPAIMDAEHLSGRDVDQRRPLARQRRKRRCFSIGGSSVRDDPGRGWPAISSSRHADIAEDRFLDLRVVALVEISNSRSLRSRVHNLRVLRRRRSIIAPAGASSAKLQS